MKTQYHKPGQYIWWRNDGGTEYISQDGAQWFYYRSNEKKHRWEYHDRYLISLCKSQPDGYWQCNVENILTKQLQDYKLYSNLDELMAEWLPDLI